MSALHLVTIDIAEADLAIFESYESQVLPLLAAHGGRLERRMRALDGRTEIHLIRFDADDGFSAYLADPVRLALEPLRRAANFAAQVQAVREME